MRTSKRQTMHGTSKTTQATRRSDKLARETVVRRYQIVYHGGLAWAVEVRS